jgi:hypothetical protein
MFLISPLTASYSSPTATAAKTRQDLNSRSAVPGCTYPLTVSSNSSTATAVKTVYRSPHSGKLLLSLPLTASSNAIITAVSGLEHQISFHELTNDRKNRYGCAEKAKIIFKLNLNFFFRGYPSFLIAVGCIVFAISFIAIVYLLCLHNRYPTLHLYFKPIYSSEIVWKSCLYRHANI